MKRVSSLFTATAIMFTGYVSLHVIHFIYMYVIAWFPSALLFLDRSFKTGRMRDCLIGGLFFGISALGGYAQTSLHFAYILFLWTILVVVQNRKESRTRLFLHFAYYALLMGFGVGIAALQYLPSVELLKESVRQTMEFEQASIGSIPFSHIITLLAPNFFGFVGGDAVKHPAYWGFPQQSFLFWETNAFLGITTLFLAARALLDIKKKPVVLFLAILALLTLLLSFGKFTPLWYLVFNYMPGFHNFRIPGRFISWFSYMMIFLGGIGLDALLKRKGGAEADKRYFKLVAIAASIISLGLVLFLSGIFRGSSEYFQYEEVLKNSRHAATVALLSTIVSISLIALVLFGKRRSLFAIALVVFTFIELYSFGKPFAGSKVDMKNIYRTEIKGPLEEKLKDGPFRIQTRLYRGEGKGEMLFPRNLGNVAMLPLTEGYNQFLLKRYSDLLSEVNDTVSQELLNVRYKKAPGNPAFYELKRIPRFYCSPYINVANSPDSVIKILNSGNFIPGKDIVLESDPKFETDKSAGQQYSVDVVQENQNFIELKVNAGGKTFLSASEIYFPAWKVYVDGKKTKMYAANLAFRAFPIEKGTHTVIMRYDSDYFRAGLIISILALLSIFYLIWERMPLPAFLREPWIGIQKIMTTHSRQTLHQKDSRGIEYSAPQAIQTWKYFGNSYSKKGDTETAGECYRRSTNVRAL